MTEQDPSSALARLSTGVAGLDVLLRGGFFRGGTYIVSGPPGTGKTVLGNQFCFSEVARGGRAVFVTVLAESHGRMIAHLRSMRFFNPELVGGPLTYVSGYGVLKAGGIDELQKFLFRLVRERRATVLVIDGMSVIHNASKSPTEEREFLHATGVHNAIAGCTTVFLSTQRDKGAQEEYALVDGIIALTSELIGFKTLRGIEVQKLRGTGQLTGKHTFDITDDGLVVYPRTESLYSGQSTLDPDPSVRLSFGLPKLDQLVGGGVVSRSSTMIPGSPGAGKTLLGLSFLREGARVGERGLYYGFAERPQRILTKARTVGMLLDEAVQNGTVTVEARVPVETLPDALVQDLLRLVDQRHVKRLVLDGLEPLAKEAIDPLRTARFLIAMFNELRSRDVTLLVTQQTPTLFSPELYAPTPGLEATVDNIILLRFVELSSQLRRLITVLKMRESDHDRSLREFLISARGIEVGDPLIARTAITGLDRPTGDPVKAAVKKGNRKLQRRTKRRRR